MLLHRSALAVIALILFQSAFVFGFEPRPLLKTYNVNNSLFPIEVNPPVGSTVDDLFPTQPRISPSPLQSPLPSNTPTGSGGNSGVIGGFNPGGVSSFPGTSMNRIGGMLPPNIGFRMADTKPEFKCNLFENADVIDVLSALNALNQAVGSASCMSGTVNAQGVQDNTKKISDSLNLLKGFLDHPETIKAEDSAGIINNVDIAIRAANAVANTFANSDLMEKGCRAQMSGGQVALALNDVLNGLTPVALMAASLTGGSAAVPYIVGGSVITSALSSMNKVVIESSPKMNDSQVRRAIVENTCQFIRLDQKYRFLIKNRDEQVNKISREILSTQNLFSANVKYLSGETSELVTAKNNINNTAFELEKNISLAISQLNLDKAFINGTSDDVKICQLGIELSSLSEDSTSYVTTLLGSVDVAMAAHGKSSIAESRALAFAGNIAKTSLKEMATQQFRIGSDFSVCAKAAKSFVETLDQSAVLAKRVMKLAQDKVEKELVSSSNYEQIQPQLTALDQKERQAERVTGSLENLRKYANSFAQSEIDSELDRLRQGLMSQRKLGTNSPVMAWFNYTQGMHAAAVKKFNEGLNALRLRAYKMTPSGSKLVNATIEGMYASRKPLDKDWYDAYQLKVFDLDRISSNTKEYGNVCREMQDVWNRWTVAIDHLSAIESFCAMLDPYIYDNRTEDKNIVQMCRGSSLSQNGMGMFFSPNQSKSTLKNIKDALVKDQTSNWAIYLKSRLDGLECPSPIF